MNQFFDFNRWSLLTARHWSENKRRYLLSIAAIAGLMIIVFILSFIFDPQRPVTQDFQLGIYFVGLALIGFFFASIIFSDLSSKSKGMNFLAVPASHFEKLLVALLYTIVIFFLVYTTIFYLIDLLMVNVGNSVSRGWMERRNLDLSKFVPEKVANVFVVKAYAEGRMDVNPFFYLFLAYFAIQSAFILGSVYFVRFGFIKTIISIVVIGLLFIYLIYQLGENGVPHGFNYSSLTSWTEFNFNAENMRMVKLPGWIESVIETILKYSLAPLFWVITYHRLKEKEI